MVHKLEVRRSKRVPNYVEYLVGLSSKSRVCITYRDVLHQQRRAVGRKQVKRMRPTEVGTDGRAASGKPVTDPELHTDEDGKRLKSQVGQQ